MSINLSLNIKGLALFKLNGVNQWKIFFPNAVDHPFKMTIEKIINVGSGTKREKSEYFFPLSTRIDFIPNDGNKPIYTTDADLENVTGLGPLHKQYFNEIPTLSYEPKKYAGFLNLEGTVLKRATDPTIDSTAEVYKVEKNRDMSEETDTIKTKINQVKVGSFLFDAFSIDADNTSSIKIYQPVLHELNLSYANGERYEVTFSNDCESLKCKEISDFSLYYDILDLTNLKGRFEFQLIRLMSHSKDAGCDPTPGGSSGEDGGWVTVPDALNPFII